MLLRITHFLIKLLFRVEIEGQYQGGKANGHDKTLIIANHSSFLDGILLLLCLPESPVFVIHKDSERSRFFRFFLRYVDYETVDNRHPMAIRRVIRHINSGRTVVIFPEGRVRVTGTLLKLYSGAAYVAIKTQATIIPIQISGAKFSYLTRLSKWFSLRLFPRIRLTIFPPTHLPTYEDLPRDKQFNRAREDMHRLMMDITVDAYKPKTLFEMLVESRYTYGKHRLMFRDTLSDDLTYGDTVKKAVSLSVLLNRKLTLSKRVGIMLPNSNACALAFYAMQHCGRTPVMINYTAGARSVNAGLTAAEVQTVLTSRRFIKKGELQPLIDEMTGVEIVYLEDLRQNVTLADKLTIAVKRYFPLTTAAKSAPDDEALVLFTSGTEGLPKGVLHSHASILTQIEQIRTIYDFGTQDTFMVCLPIFHVFGLVGGFVLPVARGSIAFLYPSPLHYKAIPELIYENGCTVLYSTSTFLAGYARFADSYDMHSLRYVIAGAEKLAPEVAKIYHEKFGVRVMEGYGATETAPVISAETTMAHKRGSVGRWIPGLIAELEPVEGIEGGGRLIVHADNVMLGYLRADNPGVIEASPMGRYGKRTYDTGDIAYEDDKGFVYLKGRIKRFAKIAGEMVSLETAERLAHHASPECLHAAIAVGDKKKGEAVHLFTTDTHLTKKQLQDASKAMGIPKLAIPKSIQVIDEIPVFASGKTNYPALTEMLVEEVSLTSHFISQIKAKTEESQTASHLFSQIKDTVSSVNKEFSRHKEHWDRDKTKDKDKSKDKGKESDNDNNNGKDANAHQADNVSDKLANLDTSQENVSANSANTADNADSAGNTIASDDKALADTTRHIADSDPVATAVAPDASDDANDSAPETLSANNDNTDNTNNIEATPTDDTKTSSAPSASANKQPKDAPKAPTNTQTESNQ